MHQRHALALVLDRVADRAVHQPLGARVADRLDADADLHVVASSARRRASRIPAAFASRAEANLRELLRKFLLEEIEHLLRFRRAGGVLDAGVDVFGVLAEDHHVDFLRMLHRRGHALEILHRPQADEEIEHLPQRDIERADAAADRRRQRSFDADEIFAERLDRVIRQPVIELVLRRLSREDFEPRDLSSSRRRPSRPPHRTRARSPPRCRARCRRRG